MATNEEIMKKLEQIINRLDALEIKLDDVQMMIEKPSITPISAPRLLSSSAPAADDAKLKALQTELTAAKQVVESSYTKEEVAEYFGAVLNDFNTKTKTDTGDVDYIISNMDVNLKAQIYKDDELKMSGANISKAGKSGVSSVRISIKAVPKQTK